MHSSITLRKTLRFPNADAALDVEIAVEVEKGEQVEAAQKRLNELADKTLEQLMVTRPQ